MPIARPRNTGAQRAQSRYSPAVTEWSRGLTWHAITHGLPSKARSVPRAWLRPQCAPTGMPLSSLGLRQPVQPHCGKTPRNALRRKPLHSEAVCVPINLALPRTRLRPQPKRRRPPQRKHCRTSRRRSRRLERSPRCSSPVAVYRHRCHPRHHNLGPPRGCNTHPLDKVYPRSRRSSLQDTHLHCRQRRQQLQRCKRCRTFCRRSRTPVDSPWCSCRCRPAHRPPSRLRGRSSRLLDSCSTRRHHKARRQSLHTPQAPRFLRTRRGCARTRSPCWLHKHCRTSCRRSHTRADRCPSNSPVSAHTHLVGPCHRNWPARGTSRTVQRGTLASHGFRR
jgi:hypothetical protein